jgi:hypothetical protein
MAASALGTRLPRRPRRRSRRRNGLQVEQRNRPAGLTRRQYPWHDHVGGAVHAFRLLRNSTTKATDHELQKYDIFTRHRQLCLQVGARSRPHARHPQSRTRREAPALGERRRGQRCLSARGIGRRTQLLCPAVDGAKGAPSVFDSTEADTNQRAPVTAMTLESSVILEGGAMLLRYLIRNAGPSGGTRGGRSRSTHRLRQRHKDLAALRDPLVDRQGRGTRRSHISAFGCDDPDLVDAASC